MRFWPMGVQCPPKLRGRFWNSMSSNWRDSETVEEPHIILYLALWSAGAVTESAAKLQLTLSQHLQTIWTRPTRCRVVCKSQWKFSCRIYALSNVYLCECRCANFRWFHELLVLDLWPTNSSKGIQRLEMSNVGYHPTRYLKGLVSGFRLSNCFFWMLTLIDIQSVHDVMEWLDFHYYCW
jgi:hypothetical protein